MVPNLTALPVFGQPGFGFPPSAFFPGPIFGHGPSTSWDVKVPASGHPTEVYWNLRTTGQWYDLIVTSDSDSGFYRRVAGHVETGRDSLTDLGMGLADRF
jgi:phospholipase C